MVNKLNALTVGVFCLGGETWSQLSSALLSATILSHWPVNLPIHYLLSFCTGKTSFLVLLKCSPNKHSWQTGLVTTSALGKNKNTLAYLITNEDASKSASLDQQLSRMAKKTKKNSRSNHFHRHGKRGKYTDTMCKNGENFRRLETYKQK